MVDEHGGADDALRPADASAGPDDAWVRGLLADLDFLRPDAADPADDAAVVTDPGHDVGPVHDVDQMPPWVWAQIGATLDAEGATGRRRPGWVRWGGGLVAASVAVLAIGLAVTSFSGRGTSDGGGTAVMAGAAPESALSKDAAAPRAAAAPPQAALAEAPLPQAPIAAAPATLSFASMVPPTLNLIGSETEYTAENLKDQVAGLLDRLDMAPAKARAAMKVPPRELAMPGPEAPALLRTPVTLRDCITTLTKVETSTALLIDWSTYQGEEAGVIVAPDYPTADQPDVTELDIWVIDHLCAVQEDDHITMP